MSGFLLDTNVLSELTREVPHPGVIAFLAEQEDLWLPSLVVHELEYGVQLLPQGRRRDHLQALLTNVISTYADRILALDRPAAESAARLRAQARRMGRPLDLGDALIAGIAQSNVLTIATRNVRDFDFVDVTVISPWDFQ